MGRMLPKSKIWVSLKIGKRSRILLQLRQRKKIYTSTWDKTTKYWVLISPCALLILTGKFAWLQSHFQLRALGQMPTIFLAYTPYVRFESSTWNATVEASFTHSVIKKHQQTALMGVYSIPAVYYWTRREGCKKKKCNPIGWRAGIRKGNTLRADHRIGRLAEILCTWRRFLIMTDRH